MLPIGLPGLPRDLGQVRTLPRLTPESPRELKPSLMPGTMKPQTRQRPSLSRGQRRK